jgi:hypothetical protein
MMKSVLPTRRSRKKGGEDYPRSVLVKSQVPGSLRRKFIEYPRRTMKSIALVFALTFEVTWLLSREFTGYVVNRKAAKAAGGDS